MSEQRLIDANKIRYEWMIYARGNGMYENVTVAYKDEIDNLPTIEQKKGKWEEKHHAYADEEKVIEEWQSCKCSVCGRYDTRPYMYYFDEPHFCSWCGADMRGDTNE